MDPVDLDLDQLKHLKDQTWQVLLSYDIEPHDSKNVSRYEKLSKLWLQLAKQVARQEQANPPEVEIEV